MSLAPGQICLPQPYFQQDEMMKSISMDELAAVQGGANFTDYIRATVKTIPPGYCRIYLGGMLLCNPAKSGTPVAEPPHRMQ